MLRLIPIGLLLALPGGCTFDTSGAPLGTVTPRFDRGADLPDAAADFPVPDVPVPDLPIVDLPVVDLPVPDLPLDDMPIVDLPIQDRGPTDLPGPDAPPPDLPVGPETSVPDLWVDPPDLWPSLDMSKSDMAKPDKGFIPPDFWPAPDVKPWPDMKPKDLPPVTDKFPWPPDVFPLPTCANLFKNDTKGYSPCGETATTCRFFQDKGFLQGDVSCNTLCKTHKCLGAWDTSSGNKCSTSNPASCSKGFNTATCICSKW